jgi:alpha-glucosidase
MGYDAESTDPLYKHFPFLICRGRDASVGLFYDNFSTSTFDLGQEIDNYHLPFFSYRAEAGDLDYYVMIAPRIRNVVTLFTKLTGRPMLPPKWSISYSGSTMTYTDAPNTQEALGKFLTKISEHGIPCRSFHMSSGYTSIGSKRYVFNWNRDKIPDPAKLVHDFMQAGVHLIPNIKPVLLDDHPLYQAAKEEGLFIQDSECPLPEESQFW